MKYARRTPVLLSLAAFALCLAPGPEVRAAAAPAPQVKERYAVVQIDSEVKVIKSSELMSLKQKILAEYKEALKAYSRARRDALKAKQRFTEPKPVQKKLKVISGSVASEAEANKIREKTLARVNGYMVVQFGKTLRLTRELEFAELTKQIEAQYREELQRYEEARKEARKSRKSFKEKKPTKLAPKVLASKLASESEARAKMEALAKKLRLQVDEGSGGGGARPSGRKVKKGGEEEEPDDNGEL
jgi:hypothetical protein